MAELQKADAEPEKQGIIMKYIEHVVREYLCDECETLLGNQHGYPFIQDGENNYCHDCALKRHLIDAEEWLKSHGIAIYDHAIYKDGEIIAYQKWGKSFRRDVVRIFDDGQKKE